MIIVQETYYKLEIKTSQSIFALTLNGPTNISLQSPSILGADFAHVAWVIL